ncbi:MAG: sugar ABC transporter ATP-binding protein [Candidatus Planktophila sp.]|jgi:ribose transport system ATP-binding protein|nr:sugar ABC transporter ATP-binding protein [Candidatus Planktophila sp.]
MNVDLAHLKDIRKSFNGVEVLHGVDLTLAPGEVLALLGENGAGKSTLVKILAGDIPPTSGSITIADTELARLDVYQARQLGVRMIFQELNDAPTLSVAENIFLGQWPGSKGFVAWGDMREKAREILKRLEVDIDVDAQAGSLRVGERQILEIARALTQNAKVLVLDEPTAALSNTEVERLFIVMDQLKKQGVGMIYITHRLDEVSRVADRVQVLRDGNSVLTVDAKGAQRDVLVTAMLGHEALKNARPAPVSTTGNGLEITNLSSGDDFTDVSMTINAGEVVCLFGKIGSGSSEVLESIYGLRPVTGGSIQIFGKKFTPKSPQESSSSGIGYLPADRQRLGSFGSRSVAENLAVASWKAMSRLGFVDAGNEVKAFSRWSDALKISARRGPTQEIATLSGGNQQKVLLGRWFEAKVQVLLLVEPTRGVDVGARRDIYDIIRRQAKESGMAVLVATSDYEEVVLLADRALVMSRGKIVSEFTGNSVEATSLISAAS